MKLSVDKYRTMFDIEAELLVSLGEGLNMSNAMHRCRVSYRELKKMLTAMTKQGMIEREGEKYKVTSRGEEFLWHYGQLARLMGRPARFSPVMYPKLLERAKLLVDDAKKKDVEERHFKLLGRTSSVLTAAAYCIVAEEGGANQTLYDISRLFGVSSTSIGNVKKLIKEVMGQGYL